MNNTMNNLFEDLSKKVSELGDTLSKGTSVLGQQIGRTTGELGKKTEEALAIQKIKNEIRLQETKNTHNCIDIGELVYDLYENGEQLSTELVEICKVMEQRLDVLDELESRLAVLKGVENCDSCGKSVEYASVYCNQCGEKMNESLEEDAQEDMEESKDPEFEVEFLYEEEQEDK